MVKQYKLCCLIEVATKAGLTVLKLIKSGNEN